MEDKEKIVSIVYESGAIRTFMEFSKSINEYIKTQEVSTIPTQEVVDICQRVLEKISNGEVKLSAELMKQVVALIGNH